MGEGMYLLTLGFLPSRAATGDFAILTQCQANLKLALNSSLLLKLSMLLCVTALLPVSSQACAHLCSCASFSPRFSQLFWFLSAAAALSNSCTQQSCQVRSLYFHCFLLTDFFQTDLVVLTLSLVVGRRHLYLLLSGFRPCTVSLALSLNCKKPSILVVFAFLFHSSKNRGIMRRYMQT